MSDSERSVHEPPPRMSRITSNVSFLVEQEEKSEPIDRPPLFRLPTHRFRQGSTVVSSTASTLQHASLERRFILAYLHRYWIVYILLLWLAGWVEVALQKELIQWTKYGIELLASGVLTAVLLLFLGTNVGLSHREKAGYQVGIRVLYACIIAVHLISRLARRRERAGAQHSLWIYIAIVASRLPATYGLMVGLSSVAVVSILMAFDSPPSIVQLVFTMAFQLLAVVGMGVAGARKTDKTLQELYDVFCKIRLHACDSKDNLATRIFIGEQWTPGKTFRGVIHPVYLRFKKEDAAQYYETMRMLSAMGYYKSSLRYLVASVTLWTLSQLATAWILYGEWNLAMDPLTRDSALDMIIFVLFCWVTGVLSYTFISARNIERLGLLVALQRLASSFWRTYRFASHANPSLCFEMTVLNVIGIHTLLKVRFDYVIAIDLAVLIGSNVMLWAGGSFKAVRAAVYVQCTPVRVQQAAIFHRRQLPWPHPGPHDGQDSQPRQFFSWSARHLQTTPTENWGGNEELHHPLFTMNNMPHTKQLLQDGSSRKTVALIRMATRRVASVAKSYARANSLLSFTSGLESETRSETEKDNIKTAIARDGGDASGRGKLRKLRSAPLEGVGALHQCSAGTDAAENAGVDEGAKGDERDCASDTEVVVFSRWRSRLLSLGVLPSMVEDLLSPLENVLNTYFQQYLQDSPWLPRERRRMSDTTTAFPPPSPARESSEATSCSPQWRADPVYGRAAPISPGCMSIDAMETGSILSANPRTSLESISNQTAMIRNFLSSIIGGTPSFRPARVNSLKRPSLVQTGISAQAHGREPVAKRPPESPPNNSPVSATSSQMRQTVKLRRNSSMDVRGIGGAHCNALNPMSPRSAHRHSSRRMPDRLLTLPSLKTIDESPVLFLARRAKKRERDSVCVDSIGDESTQNGERERDMVIRPPPETCVPPFFLPSACGPPQCQRQNENGNGDLQGVGEGGDDVLHEQLFCGDHMVLESFSHSGSSLTADDKKESD
ncbi:unnamed protein product [Vitrella brassicaformis CCMP3155]|uniref:Uncharacterized protein n=1 Tax=Vitrella brassicaformis (strain CCMP3155) TaxID=1169540 RepID=A0A0G4EQ77_VITBC|nr:unnamed protein product [Vitrella brassicaformis CCMP3155]|eukprot:CEL99442.1 unnamed protein product [Vitrella brassicaformis CCMP3155]